MEAKHPEITRELQKRLEERRYGEYLPPVRALVKEFNTSIRTMTKALKPLIEAGLLLPTRGGTRICLDRPVRPKVGIVNIVYRTPANPNYPLPNDVLLLELRRLAGNAGYKTLLMEISDDEIFYNLEFWKSARVDGHIFVYSSFYDLLSRQLMLHNIPFVVANWTPYNFGVNWVDFNNEQILFSLTDQLIRHTGSRRIALSFPGSLPSGTRRLQEWWENICQFFQLPDYLGDGRGLTRDLAGAARQWAELPEPPEIVICHHADPDPLVKAFAAKNLPLSLLVRQDSQPTVFPSGPVWQFSGPDYRRLGAKVWEVFAAQLNGSGGRPRGHLLESEPVIDFR